VQAGLPDVWVLSELCGFLLGVPPSPPLPARNYLVFIDLQGVCVCKIFQLKGLRPKSSKQRVYGGCSFLKWKAPALCRGFS
jgi:hypothetical protein